MKEYIERGMGCGFERGVLVNYEKIFIINFFYMKIFLILFDLGCLVVGGDFVDVVEV